MVVRFGAWVVAAVALGCGASLRGASTPERNEPPLRYWAEQIAGAPLPETARTRAGFEALPRTVTFPELLRRVGPPDAETAGAVPVYLWRLEDGDTIQVTTPDLVTVQTVYWLQERTRRRVLLLGR